MDPTMAAIMVFFLTAITLTGGFVLLIPLSRQFARYLEYRMQGSRNVPDNLEAELRNIRLLVEGMDDKLRSVSERQEFLERILEARDAESPKLPR